MDIRQLEVFVKVIEMGSFSKAAKYLYLTQPTVSTHIVSLEKELNVQLVARTTKSVTVTSDGEKLFGYAKQILKIRNDMYEDFGKECDFGEQIVIGGSTIPSQYILPELIPEFQKKHKNIMFNINQGDSDEIIKEILKHKVDIGFVGFKTDNPKLIFLPFYKDRLVIITPNEEHYVNILNKKKPLNELLREPLLLRENTSGTKKNADKFLDSLHINTDNLNIVARMNDPGIIKRSVSKGMGITIISKKSVLDYYSEGKILMYEPEGDNNSRDLYIVFEKNKRLNKIEKRFIEFCSYYYNHEDS